MNSYNHFVSRRLLYTVKPLILGWATTKAFWTWLGASPVDRAYVPITLSIHEWEEKKSKKSSKVDEPEN